ncbi:MAG: hypothetical protein LBT53_06400, partial [Puniceicoccales bacterium]|nr:hypothetical protein [Puniceicoccales bacterium]
MNTSNILPLSSVEKILHDLPLNDRIKTDALRWLKHVGTDHRIKVSDLDGEFPSTLDRASVNRAINRLLDAINKAATTKGIRFAAEISPNKRDGAAGRWIWFTGALADPNPPNTRELNGARGKLYNPSAVSGDPPI